MVKVDLVCYIMGKGVHFVPIAMQHGATEDVLLCALCATRRCDRRRASVAKVRAVRHKDARCSRQRCALCANITFIFTTDRGRLPCGKMVRIFKSVFVQLLSIPLTYDLLPNMRDLYGNSGIIYPGSPSSLMVLLV